VVNAIVHHEAGAAGIEVLALARENAPSGAAGFAVLLLPLEHLAVLRVNFDAEVLLIPLAKLLRIVRLEEDAADFL